MSSVSVSPRESYSPMARMSEGVCYVCGCACVCAGAWAGFKVVRTQDMHTAYNYKHTCM